MSEPAKAPQDKLRAEWFWIDRWDGSAACALPLLARGLYRELLTRSWRLGGSLPNDPVKIRALARVTPAEWAKAWPEVKAYWREDPADPTRLYNETQREVMADGERRRALASEHGRKGARARFGHASGNARALPGDKPPSPSPEGTDKRTARPPAPEGSRHGLPGELEQMLAEAKSALAAAVKATGRHADELLAEASRFRDKRGADRALSQLDGCDSLPWLQATRDRLLTAARLATLDARKALQEGPPARTAEEHRAHVLRGIEEAAARRN